jgi:transposase-like protein
MLMGMIYKALSLLDFTSQFSTQDACITAIIERRWPSGWNCAKCGGNHGTLLKTRRAMQCLNRDCRAQSSVTAGTVFEALKIPLPKVFAAMYLMTDKQGISAMSLAKHLEVAYNTAFDLLHKLRLAMENHDAKYSLKGILQVDEAYVGGHGDGKHKPGRSTETKTLVGVAVEQLDSNVSGYINIKVLDDASSNSLHKFILNKIEMKSELLTDDWSGYNGIDEFGYVHDPIKSPGGPKTCSQWPLVHRAISNFKNWLLGTHRNFCQKRLPSYAAEYCWRSNRRNMTKEEHGRNLREILLPDRLIFLGCNQKFMTTNEVRFARSAA